MTLPMHTEKHVRAEYRKYQVVAIFFAAITLVIVLITAVSGIQLAKLRKKEAAAHKAALSNPPVAVALTAEIERLKSKLEAEKAKSTGLGAKVADLQKKMAAGKATQPAPSSTHTAAPPATAATPQTQGAAPADGAQESESPKGF